MAWDRCRKKVTMFLEFKSPVVIEHIGGRRTYWGCYGGGVGVDFIGKSFGIGIYSTE